MRLIVRPFGLWLFNSVKYQKKIFIIFVLLSVYPLCDHRARLLYLYRTVGLFISSRALVFRLWTSIGISSKLPLIFDASDEQQTKNGSCALANGSLQPLVNGFSSCFSNGTRWDVKSNLTTVHVREAARKWCYLTLSLLDQYFTIGRMRCVYYATATVVKTELIRMDGRHVRNRKFLIRMSQKRPNHSLQSRIALALLGTVALTMIDNSTSLHMEHRFHRNCRCVNNNRQIWADEVILCRWDGKNRRKTRRGYHRMICHRRRIFPSVLQWEKGGVKERKNPYILRHHFAILPIFFGGMRCILLAWLSYP